MKSHKKSFEEKMFFLVISFLFFSFFTISSNAQTPDNAGREVRVLSQNLKTLENVDRNIKNLNKRLLDENENHKEIEEEIEKNINLFIELSTGVILPYEKKEEDDAKGRNLTSSILELLSPLVNTLKRITERPRYLEGLKSSIDSAKNEISLKEEALKKIETVIKNKGLVSVKASLSLIKERLEESLSALEVDLQSSQGLLERETLNQESAIEIIKGLFDSFFRTKGKNLALFFLTFFLTIFLALKMKKLLYKSTFFLKHFSKYLSAVNLFYYSSIILLAFLLSLLTLYILQDWMFLTLFALLAFALLWSLKQYGPALFMKYRLLLNMGSVRKGERIVIDDIPWKIVKLSFNSILVNPILQNAFLRMPLEEMLNYQSRPMPEDERWFVTNLNDDVLIDDSILGKVVAQSPEGVCVQKENKTFLYYKTSDFISKKIENISKGYSVHAVLGLDYCEQKRIFTLISEIESSFNAKFSQRSDCSEIVKKTSMISVSFHSAGESTLNLLASINAYENMAAYYFFLQRLLQALFVDVANDLGLSIPYKQVHVHLESVKEKN